MSQQSPSIANLAAALVAAQAEFPVVPFNATNPFLHNKYADLGSVIATAKATLVKYGLAVSQLPSSQDSGSIGIDTILMHTSGEYIKSTIYLPLEQEKGLKSAQVAGSVFSYLRRYALSAVLGLYADEDTDGNGSKETGKKAETKVAAKVVETIEQGKQRLVKELANWYPGAGAIATAMTTLKLVYSIEAHEPIKFALIKHAKANENQQPTPPTGAATAAQPGA